MWLSKCVRLLILIPVLMLATNALAQSDLPHISAIEATNYIDQKVIVVDKVAQVALRSNVWLLHLSLKYPKSPLNVTIRREATNNFPNIEDYLNQRVEITGKIKQGHGRLEMAISSTNQIKIVSATVTVPTPAPAQAEIPPATSKEAAATAPVAVATSAVQPAPKAEENSGNTLKWILGLLAVISVMVAAGIVILWRRPSNETRALATTSSAVGNSASTAVKKAPENIPTDPASVEEWKQRALAAEAMAGKQGQILREKMMPELTEFAKQSLVQGLYAQRNVLLENQRKAQEAVSELEARLNAIQAPLQDRIRAYEKRIVELEKEVETQGEEMRELTRATLTLVRRKLEDERMTAGEQFQSQSRLN